MAMPEPSNPGDQRRRAQLVEVIGKEIGRVTVIPSAQP